MQNQILELFVTPQSFFKEEFDKARSSLKCQVPLEVEFYVVNLLCEFIDPKAFDRAFNCQDQGSFLERPLALVLKDAVEAPEFQRVQILRRLGDVSLYLSGFFQDYFNRKTFDIGYYVEIGTSAYSQVADLQKQVSEHGKASPFSDLSKDFLKLVDVLAQISDASSTKTLDTLTLYDRWVRSGSPRLLSILESQGVTVLPNVSKAAQ